MADILDGKWVRDQILADWKDRAAALSRHKRPPGLAVVLVGNDAGSEIYVRNKIKACEELGIYSEKLTPPPTVSTEELLAIVESLNQREEIDGILVQMPLPRQVDSRRILVAVRPDKDVDGFHPVNVGRLGIGEQALIPCTPRGSVILAKSVLPDLSGLNAVVVGRSNIVGKPMLQLLLQENCTVTVAHSRTKDLPAVVRQADLVIAAVGRPEMIKGDWIKPGATVIDVGINRITKPDGKGKLVGDVDYASCAQVAGAITPVPGGVGPMTIACLLQNTVDAAKMQHGIKG
jgi:methylenetetrahydrofolate dehydrogenase (NADP+)/methenyltetrahydrofolate cyclohydrolase